MPGWSIGHRRGREIRAAVSTSYKHSPVAAGSGVQLSYPSHLFSMVCHYPTVFRLFLLGQTGLWSSSALLINGINASPSTQLVIARISC